MSAFFEETWFLWWILAVIIILQWFAANSVDHLWEGSSPQFEDEDRNLSES